MSKFIRAWPKKQTLPSLKGKFIVDTYRGIIRVRSWPRKRGPSKSIKVQRQVAWWKSAIALAKRVEPGQQKIAIAAVPGTGLYPRDLLINAMAGGMFDFDVEGQHTILMRRPFVERHVYIGAILQQTEKQTLPLGQFTPFIWPLPVLDTSGFWSIANPTRLTIPADVNIVQVFFGWHNNGLIQTGTIVPSIKKNGTFIARSPHRSEGFPGGYISSGARIVEEGDFFEAFVFAEDATETDGTFENFMTLQVLDTSDGGP